MVHITDTQSPQVQSSIDCTILGSHNSVNAQYIAVFRHVTLHLLVHRHVTLRLLVHRYQCFKRL